MFVITCALLSSAAALPQPHCDDATSTTIAVSWDAVDQTDLYYVALHMTPTAPPFALQTTDRPSVTLIDLRPATAYYVTVRSHPSESNIVWGWRSPSPAVRCTTSVTMQDRPHLLRRVGDKPEPHAVSVAWDPSSSASADQMHDVGIRQVGSAVWSWHSEASLAARDVRSGRRSRELRVEGLTPGSTFEVVVSDGASGLLSEPLVLRTSAVGALHTRAYRASEYSFDVDFLENHDAASRTAMPVREPARIRS